MPVFTNETLGLEIEIKDDITYDEFEKFVNATPAKTRVDLRAGDYLRAGFISGWVLKPKKWDGSLSVPAVRWMGLKVSEVYLDQMKIDPE